MRYLNKFAAIEKDGMISQFSEIPSMPYAERLNVIHRLRLLRNTTRRIVCPYGYSTPKQ